MDGIVDLPYNMSGSGDGQDNYPTTTIQTDIPEFGFTALVVIALLVAIVSAKKASKKTQRCS